jgi:hypothetical protein
MQIKFRAPVRAASGRMRFWVLAVLLAANPVEWWHHLFADHDIGGIDCCRNGITAHHVQGAPSKYSGASTEESWMPV